MNHQMGRRRLLQLVEGFHLHQSVHCRLPALSETSLRQAYDVTRFSIGR